MTDHLTALVVAESGRARELVATALDSVYGDLTVFDHTQEPAVRRSPLDCVVAVSPLDGDHVAAVKRAVGEWSLPLIVLGPPSEQRPSSEQGPPPLLGGDVPVTDVVAETGDDRYTALAHRVRGVVESRQSAATDQTAVDSSQHLQELSKVGTDTDRSFAEKADRMLEIGMDRLGVENAHLSTVSREAQDLEVVASIGDLPIEPGQMVDLPTTFCRQTVGTDDLVAYTHASEQGWAGDPAHEETGIECYLGARVVVAGSLYGTVCFVDRTPHESFSEAERAFVQLIARWLGHELERTRRRDALEALNTSTRDLVSADGTDDALREAVETAIDIVDGSVAASWQIDASESVLELAHSRGADDGLSTLRRTDTAGEGLWAAIDDGSATTVEDGKCVGFGADASIEVAVVVPLGTDGVLVVGSESADAFDAIDRSLLSMLGSTTETALERAGRIEELTAAQERLRRIFESASDALLLVDLETDEHLDCNDRACELLGYDRVELLREAPSTICRDELDRFRALAADVRQLGRGKAEDVSCRRKDGKRIPTSVSASVVELPDRTALLVSIRDITERKRRDQALNVFNRVLRHNIRNGMNVVMGHAGVVEARTDDQQVRESTDQIISTANELTELGEKARTVQQLDDREAETESVDAQTVVTGLQRSLQAEYPTASFGVDGLEDGAVAIDSNVEIALRELCENAIEHTAAGSLHVDLTLSEGDQQLALTVADEGAGLGPQDCAVLESDMETPLHHGSGLGLWLTSWVVESAGGSIEVVDSSTDGTTIRLHVPAERSASVPAQTAPGDHREGASGTH
jgi:PAS domain S-box-containing protein